MNKNIYIYAIIYEVVNFLLLKFLAPKKDHIFSLLRFRYLFYSIYVIIIIIQLLLKENYSSLFTLAFIYLTVAYFSYQSILEDYKKHKEHLFYTWATLDPFDINFFRKKGGALGLNSNEILFYNIDSKQITIYQIQSVSIIYFFNLIPLGIKLEKDTISFKVPFPKRWKQEIEKLYKEAH